MLGQADRPTPACAHTRTHTLTYASAHADAHTDPGCLSNQFKGEKEETHLTINITYYNIYDQYSLFTTFLRN